MQWIVLIKPHSRVCFVIQPNIVAAFRGMHVSPVKHSYVGLPRKWDYRTDTQMEGHADAGQSNPYAMLCRRLKNSVMQVPVQTSTGGQKDASQRSLCAYIPFMPKYKTWYIGDIYCQLTNMYIILQIHLWRNGAKREV